VAEYSRPCFTYWSEDDRRACRDEATSVVVTTEAQLKKAAEIRRETVAEIKLKGLRQQTAQDTEKLRIAEASAIKAEEALKAIQRSNKKMYMIGAAVLIVGIVGGYFIFGAQGD